MFLSRVRRKAIYNGLCSNVNKNIVFIVLVILFLTGGLVGYKVGEVACQEIINAQDVVHKFKIGGIKNAISKVNRGKSTQVLLG